MTKPLNELSLLEAARSLRERVCSVQELWDACMAAAEEKNPALNAYLELFPADDAAIAAAQKRIDTEKDKAPLLCGIPVALKDNILIEGRVASAASRMLENYRATYDATVVKKLREAGALFLGRTNMDEFALGGSTENSAFGVTKNPHDASRVSGGTSGGSAAAVAAHLAIAALGTDTGGSVRNPASFCGVVGLKPTYGGVSRSGVIAAASSFDQVGALAKTVEDAAALLALVSGSDPLDSTTLPAPLPLTAAAASTPLTIGVLRSQVESAGVDEDVRALFSETLETLKAAGHTIVDIEIPSAAPALAAYYIINFAEVSTNLSRYDGMRYGLAKRGDTLLEDYVRSRTEGFGPESRRRILLGTYVLSSGYVDAYYKKAVAARRLLAQECAAAFMSVDVIATPTMPTPAFAIGAKNDPLALYLEDLFTITANLTGMPALSVPMGRVERDGVRLPVGMHFLANAKREDNLISIGKAVEKLAKG
jgi:aspartyl-tRNA(Asn)/glutamyl-tRNA(Gln) amidotransferase subunit A